MRRFFGFAVAGLIVFISCKTKPTPSAAAPADSAPAPKITMFYAPEPVVAPGEAAMLCYGTESVETLVLDPPAIGPAGPSPNRCVEVKPSGKTTYTLTATSASGQTVKQSVEIAVDPKARRTSSPPAAAAPTGPHIHYFRLDSTTQSADGASYKLCFMTQNAERVEMNPPVIPASRVALGCFSVVPSASTTYTLTVTGKDGTRVRKSLTVGN